MSHNVLDGAMVAFVLVWGIGFGFGLLLESETPVFCTGDREDDEKLERCWRERYIKHRTFWLEVIVFAVLAFAFLHITTTQ